MACQAGPDGVVTIVPASTETTFPPSMANLPSGQRLPGDETGDPNLQPAMTMSTADQFSGGVCHTCPITGPSSIPFRDGPGIILSTASASESLVSRSASGSSSGGSSTLSSATAISGSVNPNGPQVSHSCSSESSLSVEAVTTSSTPVCGCTSTSTPISSSSCSESLMAQATPTPSISSCSAEGPPSSMTAISPMTVLSTPATNTSCSPEVTIASHSLTTSKHHTPVSDAHIPMKPSSSCSFSNSTSLSTATIEMVTSILSRSSSTDCSTTKTPSSSACATSALSVAVDRTPSTSKTGSTMMSTSTVTRTTSAAPLDAYFTTLILPEYNPATTQSATTSTSSSASKSTNAPTSKSTTTSIDEPVTVMSIPSYGEPPPAYDKVSIAAASSTTPASHTTSSLPSTAPASTRSSTPVMYGHSDLPTLRAFTDEGVSVSRSASVSGLSTLSSPAAALTPPGGSSTVSTRQAGTASATDTTIATATVGKDGVYHNPESQLFVTIVEPNAAGELQTTTLTVSEKSPWVAKRLEESGSMTTMAPIPEMAVSTQHHGRTVTVNTTLFMTVTSSSALGSATNMTTVVQASATPESKPLAVPLMLGAILVIWWFL